MDDHPAGTGNHRPGVLKISLPSSRLFREALPVQKLGKNLGGYFGEIIDIRAVLHEVETVARAHGWTPQLFYKIGDLKLYAWHRAPAVRSQKPEVKIYISAGIHGDEPAGPLAALRLIKENQWPTDAELWLLPCLNPEGFILGTRENAEGIDLNRDYRQPKSPEAAAHIAWLERQPDFDLYLCLHEDWESHGFYLYEQNPDNRPSLAKKMIASVKEVCAIDPSEIIEGRPAQNGIIRPNISPQERPDWPEALYLISHKSRQGYTLEAPSDFPLPVRINALVAAVRAALAG